MDKKTKTKILYYYNEKGEDLTNNKTGGLKNKNT